MARYTLLAVAAALGLAAEARLLAKQQPPPEPVGEAPLWDGDKAGQYLGSIK